jgi:PRD1 phage membrane DNA delivery
MSQITEAIVSIGALVVGLAILSVIVSGKSKTADVISSLSAGFANSLSAATAPVTGTSTAPVVSYNQGFGGFSNILPN